MVTISSTMMAVLGLMWSTIVAAQSSKLQWAPEEMFNPQDEPEKCGSVKSDMAYVCDPNRILGDQVDHFNWMLKDTAFNSTCPCSNFFCENNQGGAIGYKIGLAVVKKMTLQYSPEGGRNEPKDQAQMFAYHLESKSWNMGSCEEDIVIFYSVDDGILSLYGGSTANAKLTPYYRKLLAFRVGPKFRDGKIIEALNNLIHDLKLVLNCDEELQKKGVDCGLHEMRDGASVFAVSMTTIGLAVFTSLRNMFV